ncbi:MAG TPA: 16S rRNA (cytosine(1402)-N(4))-methyltransferase RsmH [Bdellovibrionales bacterium]|nr:16S rRNA (cytosine(1402)-N(4))-methyltransferase RsmH [Bdellovibrionales bacterium]
MSEPTAHVPVFLEAVMNIFRTAESSVLNVFDGTFGRGGHAKAVLDAWPEAKMVAFDWDEDAIAFGEKNFASEISSGRLKLIRSNYDDFASVKKTRAADFPVAGFDRMLLDLGVSSPQLDQAHRGFSFYHDGPLDMRMDQRLELTAADIINTFEEQELAKLFIEYGEVQRPFRVVRAIVNDRQHKKEFATTKDLAGLIERVDGWQKKGSHPATRYFMALRLKVNEELEGLSRALPALIEGLAEGGVLAVITFHSLEDRIVKHIFKNHLNVGRLVNKKVIKPDDEEIKRNPRARSAKLRAFEKRLEPPKYASKYQDDEDDDE